MAPEVPLATRARSVLCYRRRMLNPEYSTKAATIDRALRRLGKRITVTVGEAA